MEDLRKVANDDVATSRSADAPTVIVDKIEAWFGLLAGVRPARKSSIGHLKESKYPSYREWAAEQLAFVSDAVVTPGCGRSLARGLRHRRRLERAPGLHPQHRHDEDEHALRAQAALRKLKKDADPRVASESGQDVRNPAATVAPTGTDELSTRSRSTRQRYLRCRVDGV